ncbi:MAG: hypothetical protein AB1397_03165 [bacterium]
MKFRRKYAKELLVAFKAVCEKISRQGAKQYCALGIGIVSEAGIELPDYKHTARSPLFGEIASAFYEMIDNKWIEEVDIDEQAKRDFYFEYKEPIMKICGGFYSDKEQMKRILSKDWPLGDHWFRLTTKGEELIERIKSYWLKRKIWYPIKDNTKIIILTVISVIIAHILITLISLIFKR